MTDAQKILLQLLKELDAICRTHDITYYFIGGSALGAVRHHGFIPWDDDADIVMDYWNYMKFVEVMGIEKLPANRNYSDAFLPPYTQTNIFGRYSSTDTTQIFDGVAYQEDNNNGIKVDVFMLIPCPDEGEERELFLRRFRRWSELAHPTARNKDADPNEYWEYALRQQKEGMHPLRHDLFKAIDCEQYSKCKQYLYCYEKRHYFYDRDIFGTPEYFPFEDMKAPVPTKYQKHFRTLFGDDWQIIPSAEGQVTHRTTEDLQRDYTYYTRDYMRFKDSTDFQMRQNYKHTVLEYWQVQKSVDCSYAQLKTPLLTRKYELFWQRCGTQVKAKYNERRFKEVLEDLSGYVADQTGSLAQASDMFLEVPEEMISIACLSAIFSSKIKTVRTLLRYIPSNYSFEGVVVARKLLSCKDTIVALLEEGDQDGAQTIVDQQLIEYPFDRDLLLWKAEFATRCYKQRKQPLLKETVETICLPREDDGQFEKLLGDIAYADGDKNLARARYASAVQRTDNGMTLLEIESVSEMGIKRPEVISHG